MKRNTKLFLKAYAQLIIGASMTMYGAKLFLTYLGNSNAFTPEFWYSIIGATMFALGIVYGIIRSVFTLQKITEERILLKVSKKGLFQITDVVVDRHYGKTVIKMGTPEGHGPQLTQLLHLLKPEDTVELVYDPKILERKGEQKSQTEK